MAKREAKHGAILHLGQLHLEQGFLARKHQVWLQLGNKVRQQAVAWACIRDPVLSVSAWYVGQTYV